MPKQLVYIAVEAFVPPSRPSFPGEPGQGLPPVGGEGPWEPGWPDQGLPPGIGGGPIFPGPEYPDQGLPRPPRPVYPIIEDHELGGHDELPDLNMTRRITITDGQDQFTAYAVEPEPPQVEEGYEPRWPTKGLPGSWVVVLYRDALTWAWVRTPGAPGEPVEPEREPKFR